MRRSAHLCGPKTAATQSAQRQISSRHRLIYCPHARSTPTMTETRKSRTKFFKVCHFTIALTLVVAGLTDIALAGEGACDGTITIHLSPTGVTTVTVTCQPNGCPNACQTSYTDPVTGIVQYFCHCGVPWGNSCSPIAVVQPGGGGVAVCQSNTTCIEPKTCKGGGEVTVNPDGSMDVLWDCSCKK